MQGAHAHQSAVMKGGEHTRLISSDETHEAAEVGAKARYRYEGEGSHQGHQVM